MDGIIHQDICSRIAELSQNAEPAKLVRLVKNSNTWIAQLRLNVNYSLSALTMMTDV